MSGRRNQRGSASLQPTVVAFGGIVLLMVIVLAVRALAQTSGGYLSGGELGVGVGVSGGTSGTGGSSSYSPPAGGGGGAAPVPTCTGNSTPDQPDATNETGPERYVAISPDSGIGKALDSPATAGGGLILNAKPSPDAKGTWYMKYCGANGFAGYTWAAQGTPPGPPPPPPAPTGAEVFDKIPIPTPAWGLSPRGDGLTGLPTWLWDSNGDSPRSVVATIRGWTATATASPTHWEWTMSNSGEPGPASRSNPSPTVTASQPGSEAAPAATYSYQTPGGYTLTLRVSWTGTYTYTRPGFATTTAPLGTSTRTATRSYQVASISPVLVSG
jgi:hypothetical protein